MMQLFLKTLLKKVCLR